MKRTEIADLIFENLSKNFDNLKDFYHHSNPQIKYFYLDDLLPEELVIQAFNVFPSETEMFHRKDIRENKFVSAQMNKHNPLLEELIYAFQDDKIVNIISQITDLQEIEADTNLYAGGISMMKKHQFLNPHLDNSHDKDRKLWRVLNLLFYITPNWHIENGGNLELWPNGLSQKQTTIESKFNRLVVMETHNESLHSVSKVMVDVARNCISNYYFSKHPARKEDTFHVTSFRNANNKIIDYYLQFDAFLRMSVRKIFKKGIVENPHVYKKD